METAALEIQTTADGEKPHSGSGPTVEEKGAGAITEETIQRTIDSLEDVLQKDFIRKCLKKDPKKRLTARELLFHPVLFEVHSLKLLAAHSLVNTPGEDSCFTMWYPSV